MCQHDCFLEQTTTEMNEASVADLGTASEQQRPLYTSGEAGVQADGNEADFEGVLLRARFFDQLRKRCKPFEVKRSKVKREMQNPKME